MNRDNLFFGILIGSIAPLVAFIMTHFNLTGIDIGNKSLSFYALGAILNLILMRYYYRKELGNTAGGIILVTFIGALLVFFLHEATLGE